MAKTKCMVALRRDRETAKPSPMTSLLSTQRFDVTLDNNMALCKSISFILFFYLFSKFNKFSFI